MPYDKRVAETILAQLGGTHFVAMTGASSFAGSNDGLTFRIPRNNKNRIFGVRIKLDPTDTYTVEFLKSNPRTLDVKTFKRYTNVYCDMLPEIFTEVTGLYTSL